MTDGTPPGARMKKCTRCLLALPFARFAKNRSRPDGLQSQCKDCQAAYYAANSEKIRAQVSVRQAAALVSDPDRVRELGAARQAKYRAQNRDLLRARRLAAYAENPEFHRARVAAWYAANRDNPRVRETRAVHSHRRRARLRGDGDAEKIDRTLVGKRDGWKCGICRGRIKPSLTWPHPKSPSLDHIVPLALGGTHSWNNVQIAHLVCNTSKQHRAQDVQQLLLGEPE